jgi:casein kinase II subunit alpha
MFAGMMFCKEPFFKGIDNDDQLIRIAKVIGTEDILNYVKKNNHIKLSEYFEEHLLNFKKKPWDKFVSATNENLVCQNHGFDLLTKMLTIDHSERITASEAM